MRVCDMAPMNSVSIRQEAAKLRVAGLTNCAQGTSGEVRTDNAGVHLEEIPIPPFIGEREFGFTLSEIEQTTQELGKQIAQYRENLQTANQEEQAKLRRMLANSQKRYDALSTKPPVEILTTISQIYEATKKLEEAGYRGDSLTLNLGKQFPDLGDYCPILHKYGNRWSYALAQSYSAIEWERIEREQTIFDLAEDPQLGS